ncbi:MAG: hypothetical protein IBJ03_02315 [Gemmatimonadaceae bacterium]|nr:hypothetical protein [Gemmatimonadaceae bacterium]
MSAVAHWSKRSGYPFSRAMLVVAAMLSSPLAGADAQGTAVINNQACSRTDPNVSQVQWVANGNISRECTWVGTATTEASSINGVLRASAYYDPSTIADGVFHGGSGYGASADWSDQLLVTIASGSANAAYARLTLTWNGFLDMASGGASAQFYATSTGGGAYESRQYQAEVSMPTIAVGESFSMLMPLYQNGGTFSNGLYMAMFVSILGFGSNADVGASAMFGNSAGISGVEILDANQMTLADASYRFSKELELYQPTVVSEPESLVLLLVGIVGLFCLSRRVGLPAWKRPLAREKF